MAKPGRMSLIAWAAVVLCSIAVILNIVQSKDYHFLIYAVPMLIALAVIPMIMTKMSRSAYSNAAPFYEKDAKFHRISSIDLSNVGDVVKIRGVVEKISFKWLNRPHLSINDGSGIISAILFTSLQEDLSVGEEVEILGTVMRGFPSRKVPSISAISVKKLSQEVLRRKYGKRGS